MDHKKYYVICTFLIVIPLLVGLIAYLVYRPDTYVSRFVVSIFGEGGLSGFVNQMTIIPSEFSYISKNYLPDFCWAFALESCLAVILNGSERVIVNSLVISAVFLSLMETLQITPLVSGTFDILDIAIELMAIVFSGIIINLIRKRCLYEKIN